MNFRVKLGKQSRGGLWMDLLPGQYKGSDLFDETIRVHEDAFWFLDPAIRRHSLRYAQPYAHYGVTSVSREEWENILREWEDLIQSLKTAVLPIDLKVLREVPGYARRDFIWSLARNQRKLVVLIGRLTIWIRAELETHEEVSILGI